MEVIYRDEFDFPLALQIMDFMAKGIPEVSNRGIKNDEDDLNRRLGVLNDHETPAVLVEVGFITNDKDYFEITDYRAVAEVLSKGIVRFLKGPPVYG